jgi:hypothetical protein
MSRLYWESNKIFCEVVANDGYFYQPWYYTGASPTPIVWSWKTFRFPFVSDVTRNKSETNHVTGIARVFIVKGSHTYQDVNATGRYWLLADSVQSKRLVREPPRCCFVVATTATWPLLLLSSSKKSATTRSNNITRSVVIETDCTKNWSNTRNRDWVYKTTVTPARETDCTTRLQ